MWLISLLVHRDTKTQSQISLIFSFSQFLNFSISKKESFIRHTDIDAGLIVIDVL